MKHLSNKIAFVFCLLLVASFAFAASEAEYKKLSKSWTLNADGSQESARPTTPSSKSSPQPLPTLRPTTV